MSRARTMITRRSSRPARLSAARPAGPGRQVGTTETAGTDIALAAGSLTAALRGEKRRPRKAVIRRPARPTYHHFPSKICPIRRVPGYQSVNTWRPATDVSPLSVAQAPPPAETRHRSTRTHRFAAYPACPGRVRARPSGPERAPAGTGTPLRHRRDPSPAYHREITSPMFRDHGAPPDHGTSPA